MQLLEDTRTLFKMRSMLLQRLYDRISTITWKMRFAAAAHTIWTSYFAYKITLYCYFT